MMIPYKVDRLEAEISALRADLEKVAVAADQHLLLGTLGAHNDLAEALARPGVVALLEGAKDGA